MTKSSRNRKSRAVADLVAAVVDTAGDAEALATSTVIQPSPEQGAAILADNDTLPADEHEFSDEIKAELAARELAETLLPTEAEERERLAREMAEDQAFKGEPDATAPVATLPDVIQIVTPAVSTSEPFAFIWAFLAANPTVPRKAQRAALYAYGLNENTVKTQISRYYKVGGDKALWLASEKVKRAEEKALIDQMVAEIRAKKAAEEAAAAEQAASDAADKNVAA